MPMVVCGCGHLLHVGAPCVRTRRNYVTGRVRARSAHVARLEVEHMRLRSPRTLGAAGVALLAWVLMVEGASAHVQIEPATARAGATVPVAFRLENEQPDAATVKVLVQFPRKYPIAEATPENDNTWKAKVTTRKVRAFRGPNGRTTTAVDEVVWEGGPSPKAGEFNLPQITIGPLPKNVKRLYFKVV
ncbi:MAG: DUF1775 domain-containing protein, partial [Actinobacteria bacterium]